MKVIKRVLAWLKLRWELITGKSKYTNLGDYQKKLKYMSKKELIREIIKNSANAQGIPAYANKATKVMLKYQSKKKLIRIAIILAIPATQKIEGKV